MNDEVTDINEAIKVINNLQVGFISVIVILTLDSFVSLI